MPLVFVDSLHYTATLLRTDSLHQKAHRTAKALEEQGDTTFVTSDPVLVEVLAFFCHRGERLRGEATGLTRDLHDDDGTIVVPQTRKLFNDGLDLYERRSDKAYSLTDAMSMVICQERGIRSVLTHDRHFAQEGFEILL